MSERLFNQPMGEILRSRDSIRAAGFCGYVTPFDQAANNHVAAYCARPAIECAEH